MRPAFALVLICALAFAQLPKPGGSSGGGGGSSSAAGTTITVTTDATTARTLASGDCNTTINFTNAAAIAVTVPGTLPVGCIVTVLQTGAGNVTPTGSGGLTATNDQGLVKSRTQYSMFTILVVSATLAVFQGSLQ